jgi:hypothetical protein
MPVAPLGFRFQRFPLSGSRCASRHNLSLLPFHRAVLASARTDRCCTRLQGFEHPESPFATGRRYPVSVGRSSLSVFLFEVFPHAASASCFHEASSHGLVHGAGRSRPEGSELPSPCSLFRVSKNRRVACLFRELPTSVRFSSSSSTRVWWTFRTPCWRFSLALIVH